MQSDRIDPSIRLLVREAAVPLRTSASEATEMSAQLLFGETCTLLASEGSWHRVRRDWDGYEGWLDAKMTTPLTADAVEVLADPLFVYRGRLCLSDGSTMALPLGARVPAAARGERFGLGEETYAWAEVPDLRPALDRSKLVETVARFRNVPYLWGGSCDWGIDCSGLIQTAAALCGVALPRDSSQQVKAGEAVAWEDRQAGDLAFLAKPQRQKVTHVGLLSDPGQILHASGRVRQDPLTEAGIVHRTTGQLTHHLITIRRC